MCLTCSNRFTYCEMPATTELTLEQHNSVHASMITSGEFGHCWRHLSFLLHTLLDGHVSGVGGGDEAGLREGVFQGEQLVFGDRRRPRLEHGPGSDRRQVLSLHVSERDVSSVVLDGKVAVLSC